MENQRPGGRGWGLAPATRRLLDTADPAEAASRDRQIDRAIASFLAQPVGSTVELDDALADQLIILADHFGVEQAYFTDPDVGETVAARRRRQADSGQPPASVAGPVNVAAGSGVTGAAPGEAHRPRRWAGVAVAAVAVLAGVAGGGAVGYRIGTVTGRAEALAAAPALGSTDRQATAIDPLRQVATRVLPGVVQLLVRAGNDTSTGSGIVLSPDGLLLTNNHVVGDIAPAGQITVLFQNGTSRSAHIVGRDPASDIAVVAADGPAGLTPIKLGNSDSVRVGQQVLALGSPSDPRGTVTSSVVIALNRPVVVGHDAASKAPEVLNAIQTDATINPGNSGGPLVDSHGLVIGIDTAIPNVGGDAGPAGSARLGYAIPVNQAERIAERLISTARGGQTVLGVRVGVNGRPAPLNEPPGPGTRPLGHLAARQRPVSPRRAGSTAGLVSTP
jgi:putative serine protease PepD